ncbi:hypothetical protein [Paenimyroides aestuarii]|uniref:Uncharacterized protein n=1 Tax=Paenimyroides aestuarii TaxID=2968490 RepID=A0ABY5NVT5_9FLAO|nr:hypothetical protein [Paenimyroides aestuarii]UUV22439.1 hypothetical protein NPX36_05210 [Paenimyroides aestuarii]
MKKLIYPLLAVAVFTACKKEENKVQEPMVDPPVESVNNVPEPPTDEPINVPSFQYVEADQFAKEYSNFVQDYRTATANNDSQALEKLGPKLNDYQERAVELAKRVPQEEAVAFQDFINRLEMYIR